MSGTIFPELLVIVILILANGFFAASEIAVVSARKGRLEQQAALGHHGAATALALGENPSRFLSTVQVGITVIGTFAAAFGGASLAAPLERILRDLPFVGPYASSVALALVVVAISYLSLILGELVPKRLALQNAERIAIVIAPIMRATSLLAGPIVSFLSASTEAVLWLLGRHNVAETPITEDDIMALVREGAEGGTVDAAEQALIHSVFTFTDRTVRSLMTPRTRITAIEVGTPLADVLRLIAETGYSRIPIYQDTLDQIVGILFVKDLLRIQGRADDVQLQTLLRPPHYLPISQRASAAFQQLKQNRSMLALVLDEYGQVAGLISMEDVLEALVGDLKDEYDEAADPLVQRPDGSYLVSGLLPFDALQTRLQLPALDETLRAHDFERVAGFLLALMGRVPTAGEIAEWQGYSFEIVDMDGQRIDKVLVQPPVDPPPVDPTAAILAQDALPPPPDPDVEAAGDGSAANL